MKVRSRFSYFRDKLQVFFLGLLFGLVLGGGFFVLKLDSYVKELSFYKSLTEKDDKTSDETADLKADSGKPKPKKPKKTSQVTVAVDSLGNEITSDSDTTLPAVFDANNDDDIVIRKDELLGQKTFAPIVVNANPAADSIPNSTASQLTVEFWKSPLNYKGYKFFRNRIVLFGFGQEDVLSLFKMENTTFLKTGNGVFRIDPSPEFHQLERVNDENLLARLQ